jgi:beta-carotene 3-hydroxylase
MINLVLKSGAFLFMEFGARFSHEYIMHGFSWSFYKSHHLKTQQNDSFFEKNDLFFLMLYCFTCFSVHDVIIHHRMPVNLNIRKGYFASLVKAHEANHSGKSIKDYNIMDY